MKISMNVELTPAELRELLGLPDVNEFNQRMVDKMVERMEKEIEGYDPLTLFKTYMSASNAGMDFFKKFMALSPTLSKGTPTESEDA